MGVTAVLFLTNRMNLRSSSIVRTKTYSYALCNMSPIETIASINIHKIKDILKKNKYYELFLK
jgi:hypothetical protein